MNAFYRFQSSFLSLVIAFVGGVLMGLAPAPVNAWPIAWIALVPLWVVIHQPFKAPSFRLKLGCGLLWGIGYHGLALSWIVGIHPMTWMGVPWLASLGIALFAWGFITLWGAGIVVCWVAGMAIVSRLRFFSIEGSPVLRVLLGVALWAAIEFLWSQTPLYWSGLAYTQSPHDLWILHLGQLSGPSAVTAAIVAVNGFLAEVWLQQSESLRLRSGLTAIGLLIGLHLLGFGLYLRPLNDLPSTALQVGIIQGNIPNTIKLYDEGWRKAIEGYTTGYRTLAEQGVDAVLTPETALPVEWSGQQRTRTSFYRAIEAEKTPVWLGAFGVQGDSLTNSLFTIGADGTTLDEYRKVKLVPLGEYIPFERLVGKVIDRLSPLEAHLVPGPPHQRVDTPFGRMIVGICYESAFSEHFRWQTAAGGQLILTASNNAHYSSTMPAQHHAQDVMRAVETDRWAARATNTGYSGIVDPHGRTVWQSGLNTYELHKGWVYRRDTQTLYVRWGDWLTPMLLLLVPVVWSLELSRSRRL